MEKITEFIRALKHAKTHGVMLLCDEVTNALWANALRLSSTRVFGVAEMLITQELFFSVNGCVSPTLAS
jgi:hypothetical protein